MNKKDYSFNEDENIFFKQQAILKKIAITSEHEDDYQIQHEGAINRRRIFMEDQISQKSQQPNDYKIVSIQEDLAQISLNHTLQQNEETVNDIIVHHNTNENHKQNMQNTLAPIDNQTQESQLFVKPIVESYLTQFNCEDDLCKPNDSPQNNYTTQNFPKVRKTYLYVDTQQSKLKKFQDNSNKNLMIKTNQLTSFKDAQEKASSSSGNQVKNYFIIITYMKKFVNQLIRRIYFRRISHLQPRHYQMLDDKAVDVESLIYSDTHQKFGNQQLNQSIIDKSGNMLLINNKSLFYYIKKLAMYFLLLNKNWIILPNSIWLVLWEVFFLIFFLIQLWVVPVTGCFDEKNFLKLYQYLQVVAIISFSIDIFIGFCTGFYEFGQVVTDKKRIITYYLQRKFIIDFICTLIFITNINYGIFGLDYFAIFIRFKQISQKIQRMNEYFRIQNRFPLTYEFIELISTLLIIAHLFGCGFYWVGSSFTGTYKNQFQYTNWIDSNNLREENLITKYLSVLYFSVITMITVGYGDITPISIYEKSYVIGMALISCGVFAYSVNTIGNIFSKLREKNVSYLQQQFQLISYMDSRNIKKQTQMKILKYLEYIERGKDQSKSQDKQFLKLIIGLEILESFPRNLREEVQREYFYKILVEESFFKMQFSQKFLSSLSLKMQEMTFGPWEKIVSRGTPLDNIYFIRKGQVQYCTDNRENNKIICDIPIILFKENTNHFYILQIGYQCSLYYLLGFYGSNQATSN